MPKQYPLEIENIGDDVCRLMSRGHHDVHEFMKTARAVGFDWPLGMPKHIWFKTVPANDGIYLCRYVEVPEGTRGAFPVTYADEAFGPDEYESLTAQAQA